MFKGNAVREAAIAASTTMGYERMKSEQLQIVESFVTGHDVFGVLPTGYRCPKSSPHPKHNKAGIL